MQETFLPSKKWLSMARKRGNMVVCFHHQWSQPRFSFCHICVLFFLMFKELHHVSCHFRQIFLFLYTIFSCHHNSSFILHLGTMVTTKTTNKCMYSSPKMYHMPRAMKDLDKVRGFFTSRLIQWAPDLLYYLWLVYRCSYLLYNMVFFTNILNT